MSFLKTATAGLASVIVLAGCEMNTGMSVEAGLSYDEFGRQYDVDYATMVSIDADGNGVISENEWQAAGYGS